IRQSGFHILAGASASHTLAGPLNIVAQRFMPGDLPEDATRWEVIVVTVKSRAGDALLEDLRKTRDGQYYQEAALFLSFHASEVSGRLEPAAPDTLAERRLRQAVAAIVCSDFENDDDA